jgi:hypothetical protein
MTSTFYKYYLKSSDTGKKQNNNKLNETKLRVDYIICVLHAVSSDYYYSKTNTTIQFLQKHLHFHFSRYSTLATSSSLFIGRNLS